jgi:ABC-type sugar transport system substrate-binding protein
MRDVIQKECPNAKIVGRQFARTMEEAMNHTEAMLTAHPNIRVISCVNDQLALGALAAVKSKGIKDDGMYIGGADYTAEAKAELADPKSYFRVSTDIGPAQAGMDCASMAYDYVKNGPKGETKYFLMEPHWQVGQFGN